MIPAITMFSIPPHWLTGIHVTSILVFGMTEVAFLANSIPSNETCFSVSGGSICYFKVNAEDVEWEKARQLCISSNSMLPVIRNKEEQDALAGYLKSQANSSVWTSGKVFNRSEWIWINGDHLNDTDGAKFEEKQEEEQGLYASLEPNVTFQALAAYHEIHYICQYEGTPCNHSSDMSVAEGCLKLSDDSRTWHDARNQCLMTDGDLAVISDNVLTMLRGRKLQHQYWIGLRKQLWHWIQNDNDESRDEIKYTNFGDNVFATVGECVSIDAYEGTWKALGCDQTRAIVCQRGQGVPSTTTMKNLQAKVDSVAFVGVGIAIVIIIICIVVIIFALRSTKKSVKKIDKSKANNNSEQNRLEESPQKPANTTVSAPINGPGIGGVDIQGAYAEIPLATLNQSEEEAKNQQSGIVYASVEFQKEPTDMEPNTKCNSAASPTKVGPLGDVYAMPVATGHPVASPGTSSSGSNSYPAMVTAQGDVYALPMKNAKSPTTTIQVE